MKFTNAYDLCLTLCKTGVFSDFWIGLRGEIELTSKITDKHLLKILKTTLGDLIWEHAGQHKLHIDSNDELAINIAIYDDILDSYGNPFDIEKILAIISKTLRLNSINYDEDLEYQICIDLVLEYENLKDSKFVLPAFNIKSCETGNEISKELGSKLIEPDLTETKKQVLTYILKMHNNNNHYDGFSLKIEGNYFSEYYGTGNAESQNLKQFLIVYHIDIELNLNDMTIIGN